MAQLDLLQLNSLKETCHDIEYNNNNSTYFIFQMELYHKNTTVWWIFNSVKTRHQIKEKPVSYITGLRTDARVNIQNEVYAVFAKFKQNAWSQVLENAGDLLYLQPGSALHQGFYEFWSNCNRGGVFQFPEERVSCQTVEYYEGDQSAASQPPRDAFSHDPAGTSEII